MNPIVKRRLPSSLQSLLTDISPKVECINTEMRNGILLPLRGTNSEPAEHLSASEGQSTVESRGRKTICLLCHCKESVYTCPRCNVPYCSLSCYKSPEHSICSEDFYKVSVLQELKEMGKTEADGRKRMQEILLDFRKKAQNTKGGMETLLKEEGVLSEESEHQPEASKINVEVMELLSRLAELQESGEENPDEIESILRKLKKLGPENNLDEDDQEEDDEKDLVEQLQRLNMPVDELSEEELWSLLNKKDKKKFVSLIKQGAFNGLVTLWKPWWEEHGDNEQVLIDVLYEEMSVEKEKDKKQRSSQTDVPPVSEKIPKLSMLCSNSSPLVGFSVVNVIFSYSFTLCFFNGDTDSLLFELCDMVLALSEALNSNKVFHSVPEALNSGEALIIRQGYLSKDDPSASTRAVEAVAHILTGRHRNDSVGYCLSALSQLRFVLSHGISALSKGDGRKKRKMYFKASKKCEFFQAWVVEYEQNINLLAIELWAELGQRQSDILSVTKAKTEVEQSLKKGMQQGSCKLVEEI